MGSNLLALQDATASSALTTPEPRRQQPFQSLQNRRFGFPPVRRYSARYTQQRKCPVRVGVTELLVILLIVLVLFGSKKLPELADGMGKAIRNFKRGIASEDEDVTPPAAPDPNKQVPPRAGVSDLKSEVEVEQRKT
jgi:sec-independent protein translocase protein TatA